MYKTRVVHTAAREDPLGTPVERTPLCTTQPVGRTHYAILRTWYLVYKKQPEQILIIKRQIPTSELTAAYTYTPIRPHTCTSTLFKHTHTHTSAVRLVFLLEAHLWKPCVVYFDRAWHVCTVRVAFRAFALQKNMVSCCTQRPRYERQSTHGPLSLNRRAACIQGLDPNGHDILGHSGASYCTIKKHGYSSIL